MDSYVYKSKYYYLVKHQKKRIKYSIHFPIEWALYDTFIEPQMQQLANDDDFSHSHRHHHYVGSVHCANCKKYGTYKGVFVQYCKDCTKIHRPGCHCMLQDIVPKEVSGELYGYECNHPHCVFKTYLKDINLFTIGKKSIQKKISLKLHKNPNPPNPNLLKCTKSNLI